MIQIKLGEGATMPVKAYEYDAGYDLAASSGGIIPVGEYRLVPTNQRWSIPATYYGRIAPRSGLAYKNGIMTMAGVIDSGYTGNVGVILYNAGKEPFEYSQGDRIAQMIIERCYHFELVDAATQVDTERGAGGFGSTG